MSESSIIREDKLLTKEELASRLSLPSVAIIETLVRKRAIPVIRLGHKTTRFDFPKVRAALDKLTVKEVGA